MCKYKPVEFQFDWEIERTARRLRREQRNLKATIDMDDLEDMGNVNPRGLIEPINVQGGHKGQNGQIIHEQPGNNNIIHMADDRDRFIREYAVLSPQAINKSWNNQAWSEVQANNLEFKLVMFQMLQTVGQFNGLP